LHFILPFPYPSHTTSKPHAAAQSTKTQISARTSGTALPHRGCTRAAGDIAYNAGTDRPSWPKVLGEWSFYHLVSFASLYIPVAPDVSARRNGLIETISPHMRR
jgi:hypothetical protein